MNYSIWLLYGFIVDSVVITRVFHICIERHYCTLCRLYFIIFLFTVVYYRVNKIWRFCSLSAINETSSAHVGAEQGIVPICTSIPLSSVWSSSGFMYSLYKSVNLWTIADHLVYFNKNLLFSIYFVGNYKKYIKKNNQYHRNTSFNIHIN